MLQTHTATTTRGSSKMSKPTSSRTGVDPLFKSVRDFTNFSAGMMVLAEMAPERLTASQLIFFMLTGTANLAGKDATYTEIKEAVGDRINKSLNTTYKVFLAPSRQYPTGLGWLEQEPNPDDNRVKFLRLTKRGREVMREVLEAMKGE